MQVSSFMVYKLWCLYYKLYNCFSGGDFERAKMLQKTALDLERKESKKARKSNKDPGFTSWADNTARQYNKLTKGVAPDWERYEREKAEMGDDFYANSGTAAILPGRLKETIITYNNDFIRRTR